MNDNTNYESNKCRRIKFNLFNRRKIKGMHPDESKDAKNKNHSLKRSKKQA